MRKMIFEKAQSSLADKQRLEEENRERTRQEQNM